MAGPLFLEAPNASEGEGFSLIGEDGQPKQFFAEPVTAGGGSPTSFVWRPGGTAADGVFVTWVALAAAFLLYDPDTPKTVAVDDSIAAAHITAAATPWNLENVTFQSASPSALATVIADDGAHGTWTHLYVLNAELELAGTTAFQTTSSASVVQVTAGAIIATAAGGLYHCQANVQTVRALAASVVGNGAHPLFTVDPAGSAQVFAFDGATVAAGVSVQGSGPGGTFGIVFDGASQALVSTSQVPAPTLTNLDPQPTFVFQPGGTGAGGANVFTTWNALMASVELSPGWKEIIIDDSLGAAHVTAGTWNVDQCRFHAAANFATGNTLIFDAGAKWTASAWLWIAGALALQATDAAASAFTVPAGAFPILYLGLDSTIEAAAGAKPWADVTGNLALNMDGSTIGDGAHNAIQIEAGGTLVIACQSTTDTAASVTAHAIAGGVGATFDAAVGLGGSISAQADFTGTLTPSFLGSAAQLGYTPATAGNWNPQPSTPKAALDQLAASNSQAGTGNTGTGTATVTATAGAITKAKNGKMRVSASAMLSSSAACTLTVQLLNDGANIGTAKSVVAAAAINAMDAGISFIDTAADNAAHTYSCTWTASAGTLTVAAGSAQIQVLEDS